MMEERNEVMENETIMEANYSEPELPAETSSTEVYDYGDDEGNNFAAKAALIAAGIGLGVFTTKVIVPKIKGFMTTKKAERALKKQKSEEVFTEDDVIEEVYYEEVPDDKESEKNDKKSESKKK